MNPGLRVPPLLLGAALMFWGWQSELLIWAGIMAVIVEGSYLIRARWELANSDLNRIWDLSALLAAGAAVLAYTSEDRIHMGLKFFQWLPISFFPILFAQVYGTVERMPMTVFSWFFRVRPEGPLAKKAFNITYLYFAGVLISASAGNQASPFFYPGMAALVTAALIAVRPRRLSLPLWLCLVAVVALVGELGHRQLRTLQPRVEAALATWISGFLRREPDTREARTAIGQIGKIKLSGRIIFRVNPDPGNPPPSYLREASYDSYLRGVWRASSPDFATVFVDSHTDTAQLLPPKEIKSTARIAGALSDGRGLLALPHGTFLLKDLPATLETNRLGASRVDNGPNLLNLLASFGPGPTADGPPTPMDLSIPEEEKPVLERVLNSIVKENKTEREKLQAIGRYFTEHFKYVSFQNQTHTRDKGTNTPVGHFLTKTRSGHCEYFATATVLLLRQAGIPARYAVGYAVPASSKNGGTYYVRERHAHAWVLVWREGKRWEEFDTTPASWDAAENAQASFWEWASDLWSDLMFQFSKWRWSKESYTGYLRWALLALIVILAWRIFFKRRRHRRLNALNAQLAEPEWPGKDSEFYHIDQRLQSLGLGRGECESLREWQTRLLASELGDPKLAVIFELHRRLRFDPQGLNSEERSQLKREVQQWLAQCPALQDKPSSAQG